MAEVLHCNFPWEKKRQEKKRKEKKRKEKVRMPYYKILYLHYPFLHRCVISMPPVTLSHPKRRSAHFYHVKLFIMMFPCLCIYSSSVLYNSCVLEFLMTYIFYVIPCNHIKAITMTMKISFASFISMIVEFCYCRRTLKFQCNVSLVSCCRQRVQVWRSLLAPRRVVGELYTVHGDIIHMWLVSATTCAHIFFFFKEKK